MKLKQVVFRLTVMAMPLWSAVAQQDWQRISMPTVAQVEATWSSPSSVYGPEPYYGLSGVVTVDVIRRDLDTLHDAGFRAVTVQAGRGNLFAYLSPEYFTFMKQFVAEAKKRDMKVWLVDDAGYPSGFAGGKFTELAPELRMQALVISEKIPVSGGESLHRDLKPEAVSVMAVKDDGSTLAITLLDTQGTQQLDWKAPEGKWTVLVVEHQFRTSPTRSETNPKNVKDTSQSLEDYLNPAATRKYLEFTHEQYKRYLGDEFGKTILGFRGDEPDYSIGGLPWTNSFFERFQQIKGYDVRPYVGASLAMLPLRDHVAVPIKMTAEQIRARADYYDVFSQLFAAGFFKPQADWCAAHSLAYQVHLNHEEMEMMLVRSEGEFFRDMRDVQLPGIDAIWHQIWKDTISDYPRLASSVAHVYGHPMAFTESFAAYRPEPDIEMARYILNEQFVRGINLVEMMYFPATSNGPRPLRSYMGEAGFSDLLTYVRRMSYLMAMGRPDASVALFLPSSSMWYGDAAADTTFVSTERLLSEHQIDFDIVSEDSLARDLQAGKGAFLTQSGNAYRTVILPAPSVLSEDAVRRLKAFASGGGKVVFLGRTPELIFGRTFKDARQATANDFSWAKVVQGSLPETPVPPQYPPAAPPEPMKIPAGMLEAVEAVVVHDPQIDSADTALRVMKRQWKDASFYLFFNEGAKESAHSVTLHGGSKAELWDPQTGKQSELKGKAAKGSVTIELPIKPYEARVIVVRR